MAMWMSASPLSQVNCIHLAERLKLHPPSLILQTDASNLRPVGLRWSAQALEVAPDLDNLSSQT